MKLPQHIFCQCMKPWPICVSKQNSYKIDIRDLINTSNLKNFIPYLSDLHINYDFVNEKWLQSKFICRFSDDKKK
jgi:hypothetical protein